MRKQSPGSNEIGFSMCRYPDGRLATGPVSEGTPMGVDIAIKCPPGSRFYGMLHTHPGGIAYPSETDINSGRRVGAETLCILVPETDELACYDPVTRTRTR